MRLLQGPTVCGLFIIPQKEEKSIQETGKQFIPRVEDSEESPAEIAIGIFVPLFEYHDPQKL